MFDVKAFWERFGKQDGMIDIGPDVASIPSMEVNLWAVVRTVKAQGRAIEYLAAEVEKLTEKGGDVE